MNEEPREVVDPTECPAIGVAGMHSDDYFDPDGQGCAWCGERRS
jgi:hypothetical protein